MHLEIDGTPLHIIHWADISTQRKGALHACYHFYLQKNDTLHACQPVTQFFEGSQVSHHEIGRTNP